MIIYVQQVFFLIDPIDEVAITNLKSYKDKKFEDINKEDLDLGQLKSIQFELFNNLGC